MAKKYEDLDDIKGVWRTIGGRRVFIKTGQSLSSAMIESGKFKNLRSNYKKAKEEDEKAKQDKEWEEKVKKLEKENAKNKGYELKEENAEKYKSVKHEGFGDYNKDNIPVYDNKIDYTGDFTNADLSKLSDEELTTALNKQTELYKEALNEKIGDQRTRNGKMDKIFNTAKKQQYEEGTNKLLEEANKRDLPRYNIYNEKNKDMILASAPTKEIAERNLKEMYETDKSLKKSYGWKELPKYEMREEKTNKLPKDWQDTIKEETFTQKSTNPLYPDREYSKEDLKKMSDTGVKPMENSYGGNGWKGVNADKNLSTSEQAKAITDEIKKQFPDVKISRKSEIYSGGSSITFSIMSSDKDLYVSDSDIDKMNDFGRLSTGVGFERWAEENVKGFKRYTNEVYSQNDVRKYAKTVIADLKKRDNQSVRGDEWYLSDYGKKVVSELNKQANSYTYDDSDAMTDYFNHGTYMWVNIGKWDKPYEVNKTTNNLMNDRLRRTAYEKYLKEHPASKMTFEEFKKK